MIVTFHLIVYFGYHIWNNYVLAIFGDGTQNSDNANFNDNGGNMQIANNVGAGSAQSERVVSRPNDTHNQPDPLSVSNTSTANDSKVDADGKAQEEVRHILHQIDFEDQKEGHKIIYDIEPAAYSEYFPDGNGMKFFPPVYLQRYMKVDALIRESSRDGIGEISKVIDFGCAELSFEQRYLKRICGLKEIVAVDIDRELLARYKIKLSPSTTDFLMPRPTPLTIRVFCGSVANTHPCLQGADAVIAIELIEHLFPPDLELLPFTVFGFIKPKLVIFTTPNVDFNILFSDPHKFRHDDHKFEWSREQFEDWGNNLVQRYPNYKVSFQGIGPGPKGTEQCGCCSQMAVFTKDIDSVFDNTKDLNVQDGTYELIVEYKYPYDDRSENEKIRENAVGFLTRCVNMRRRYLKSEDTSSSREISLKDIMTRIKYFEKEKLVTILLDEKWEVRTSSSGSEVVVLPDYGEYDESFSDYDEQDCYQQEDDKYPLTPEQLSTEAEEDWDCYPQFKSASFKSSNLQSCIHDDSQYNTKDIVSNTINCHPENSTNKTYLNFDSVVVFPGASVSFSDRVVPDINIKSDKFSNCSTNVALEQTNVSLNVYETPCVDFHDTKKLISSTGCNKVLSFDESNICCESYATRNSLKHLSVHSCEKNLVDSVGFDCFEPSSDLPCDISIYSTPCGSENYKANVPKSFSLQQIENASVSYVKEGYNHKIYNFSDEGVRKVSRSLEGLKNEESFEICKSFTSLSRVIDSGYPDSNCEQEMDLDLTLEQFDEIEYLSDNESHSMPSPVNPNPNLPYLIGDVENGDVANNNRDGEGNNLIADMDEEPLEFEAQIQVDNDIQNLDGAMGNMDIEPMDFDSQVNEYNEKCYNGLFQKQNNKNQTSTSEIASISQLSPQAAQHNNSDKTTIDCKDNSKLTLSATSIETVLSWNCVDIGEHEGLENSSNRLKTYNSLTTVLDGCSKFSECSLVNKPDKRKKSEINEGFSKQNGFPEWLIKVGDSSDSSLDFMNGCPKLDKLSVKSVYESTESLISKTSESSEKFPKWLLELSVEDNILFPRNSEGSLWDNDSYDDMNEQHVTILPIDSRGGGDPHRNIWS